jgi:membrane protein required for colicin V production
MFLDILFLIILVLGCIKGLRRGLIVGLFSFIAVIVGLAAAMKLSTVAADYIGTAVKVSDRWLPVISFIVVFILIVLLIRLGANLLQKAVEAVMLGWVNRIGGMILYAAIYILVYSVILFYAEQVHIIQPETIEKSVTYSFVQPLGPWFINGIATVLPFFRDMFSELSQFFGGVAQKAS